MAVVDRCSKFAGFKVGFGLEATRAKRKTKIIGYIVYTLSTRKVKTDMQWNLSEFK